MKRSDLHGLGFVAPALLLFCTFSIYPILKGISLSFFDAGVRQADWIGFRNYVQLFHDFVFWAALRNTIRFTLVCVPLLVVVPLVIAAMAYDLSPGKRAFLRFAYYLPVLSSGIVIGMIWLWIFNPMYGVLNYITSLFGISPIGWLGQNPWAFRSICLVLISSSLGWSIIIYMAVMSSIDKHLYEVAELDGCTWARRFWHVTVPSILPVIGFMVVIKTIGTLQLWHYIWLLTNGGPTYGTTTIVYLIYNHGLVGGRYGYASAEAVVLVFLIAGFAVVQRRFFEKREI